MTNKMIYSFRDHESAIERRVEREMSALDRAFLHGDMDSWQYETRVQRIDQWAEQLMRRLTRS